MQQEKCGAFVVGIMADGMVWPVHVDVKEGEVTPASVHKKAEKLSGYQIGRLDVLDESKFKEGFKGEFVPMIATRCTAGRDPLHTMRFGDFLGLLEQGQYRGVQPLHRIFQSLASVETRTVLTKVVGDLSYRKPPEMPRIDPGLMDEMPERQRAGAVA